MIKVLFKRRKKVIYIVQFKTKGDMWDSFVIFNRFNKARTFQKRCLVPTRLQIVEVKK